MLRCAFLGQSKIIPKYPWTGSETILTGNLQKSSALKAVITYKCLAIILMTKLRVRINFR